MRIVFVKDAQRVVYGVVLVFMGFYNFILVLVPLNCGLTVLRADINPCPKTFPASQGSLALGRRRAPPPLHQTQGKTSSTRSWIETTATYNTYNTMAGKKKKTKPASNPARGFATTSVASKPRAAAVDAASVTPSLEVEDKKPEESSVTTSDKPQVTTTDTTKAAQLNPEEYEKHLEESELQVLVEKHATKARRDASRQVTRLQTDRRLQRSQAEFLNTRKWLPTDLLDDILDLVNKDHKYASANANDSPAQKPLTEEDLTIKLWALQQALEGAGFTEDKARAAVKHILDTSDKVVLGNKDTIWGLEEALQWLARECSRAELPDYESFQTKALQKQLGMLG